MTIIGITMGCPAGIGPEIVLRLFAEKLPGSLRPVVIGDSGVLKRCGKKLQIAAPCVSWQPGTALPAEGIPVVEVSSLPEEVVVCGSPNRDTGKAMAEYITAGVKLVADSLADGLATCPISKAALNDAGYPFPGHTEMLASLTRSSHFAMMMAGTKLKVTLATIHQPLRKIPALLDVDTISDLIAITHRALKIDFALSRPRIGVAGLNPHAGEGGLFGDEEDQVIAPAVARAREQGICAEGPFPADTIFYKAANGIFDAVVCMYHDQGLIPFKLLHFVDGVNVTLGLPIVRTSVDHGTAYDIAGKGLADHRSLAEAVTLAGIISENRLKFSRGEAAL
jgi:4-hydroxythreonine-4-phosphate dehydrogenase